MRPSANLLLAVALTAASSTAAASSSQTATPQPYEALAFLIGEWDSGPANAPPVFVQRFTWGENRGYVWYATSLIDQAGGERLHFQGMIHWNGAHRDFDYLISVEPGTLAQESGRLHVERDGEVVRDVTLTQADGSVSRFRQTFRATGTDTATTSLMRQTATGWEPTFPGSDRLVMKRRD